MAAAILGSGGLSGIAVALLRHRKENKQTDLARDQWIDSRIREYTEAIRGSLTETRASLSIAQGQITQLEHDVKQLNVIIEENQGVIQQQAIEIQSLHSINTELIITKAKMGEELRYLDSHNLRLKAENGFLHEHIRKLPIPFQATGVLPPPPPLASLVVNVEGCITEADEDAIRLFGGPLVGKTVLDIVPPRYHPSHLSGFIRAVMDHEVPEHPSHFVMLRANGDEIRVGGTVTTIQSMDGATRFSVQIQSENGGTLQN